MMRRRRSILGEFKSAYDRKAAHEIDKLGLRSIK